MAEKGNRGRLKTDCMLWENRMTVTLLKIEEDSGEFGVSAFVRH